MSAFLRASVASRATGTRPLPRVRALPLLLALGTLAACRRDFTDPAVPVAATSLALQTRATADTLYVDVMLGGGAPVALGSVTGEVAHRGDWTFVQCDGQQPQTLLACKSAGETVRVAAAWAAGTHAGALVRLSFVRSTPVAQPVFMLAITEAHSARGENLLESVDVRRQSVMAEGAR